MGRSTLAYKTYWEQISFLEKVMLFTFFVLSIAGFISTAVFAIMLIASVEYKILERGVYVAIMFVFSLSWALIYALKIIMSSSDPAHWAKRVIIPVFLLTLPFPLILYADAMRSKVHRPSSIRY